MTTEGLLEAWRETRDPRVADLIDVRGAVAPKRKTLAATIEAWVEVARAHRVEDVPALVALEFPKGIRLLARVVDELVAWPEEDPRIARKLVDFVTAHAVDSIAGRKLVARACVRLAALGDVRGLVPLEARAAALTPYRRREHGIDVAIDALRAVAVRPVDAELLARHAPAARDEVTEAALLAEIAANPDDAAAIAVYGDWLVAANDPRGELIALQLGGRGPARVKELVATHGAAWAGAIGDLFEPPLVFERGMFAGGLLGRETIEPGLRHLRGWQRIACLGASWTALVDDGHVLEVPRLVELHVGPRVPPTADEVFAHYPRLATLGLWGDDGSVLRWCETSTILACLARLVLRKPSRATLAAVAARRGPCEVVLAYGMFRPGWSITLERDAAPGPFTRVVVVRAEGSRGVFELVEQLAEVAPEPVTELVAMASGVVMLERVEAEDVEQALARFTHARVSVPWVRPQAAAPAARTEWFSLDGLCTTAEHVSRAIEILAGLHQHYDVFVVGSNATQRALGKDPVARVITWLAKSWVTLQRTGLAGSVLLGQGGLGTSGEIAVDDTVTPSTIRAAIAALFHATGSTRATIGRSAMRIDLGGFPYAPSLGSVMVIDPRLARWIDRDDLAALAGEMPELAELAILPPSTFASSAAPATLALALGDGLVPIELAPALALAHVLRAVLARGFSRMYGFDFRERIHAAFDTIAAELQCTCEIDRPWRLRFEHPERRIEAWLDERDDTLVLSIAMWDQRRTPPHVSLATAVPIANRADLEAAVATALATLAARQARGITRQ